MLIMEKQITFFLILVFSIFLDQAGNISFAQVRTNGVSSAIGKETINQNTSARFSPEEVGMSSVTLARIDSIVKDGINARAFPGCQVLVMKEGKPIPDIQGKPLH